MPGQVVWMSKFLPRVDVYSPGAPGPLWITWSEATQCFKLWDWDGDSPALVATWDEVCERVWAIARVNLRSTY
jgi:hypothetical protein